MFQNISEMTKSELKEVEEISLLYFNKMQEFLNASLPGLNVIKPFFLRL